MTGGVSSGVANCSVAAAAAAATTAALTLMDPVIVAEEEEDPLPLPSLPLLPGRSSSVKLAATTPQFPLMLQAKVTLLQVFSAGPQGSYTVSDRMPMTDWLAASEAV